MSLPADPVLSEAPVALLALQGAVTSAQKVLQGAPAGQARPLLKG